jgi:hypothetical protein
VIRLEALRKRLPPLDAVRVGRRIGGPARRLTALALILLLGGCSSGRKEPGDELRTMLYLAVGIGPNDVIDSTLQQSIQRKIGVMQAHYRAIQPKVRIQVELHREDQLQEELKRRNRNGLGPDLLLIPGEVAGELAALGLTRPVSFPAAVTDQIYPNLMRRVRVDQDRLAGLPVFLMPQLACFDRRALPKSPDTLDGLMAAGAGGVRIGLPMDVASLAWTMGALGSLDSITAIASGEPVTAARRGKIRSWLSWLQAAGLQQRITFFTAHEELLTGLTERRLDWITCGSQQLDRLREDLGSHLGVAPLPDGKAGPASPASRLQVLAFGVNSNRSQRAAAESLASFSVKPQRQRSSTLRYMEHLPVNRFVEIPVESSLVLQAMVASQKQSERSSRLDSILLPKRGIEKSLRRTMIRYLLGDIDTDAATDEIISALRSGRNR